jgi:hypothetical protein
MINESQNIRSLLMQMEAEEKAALRDAEKFIESNKKERDKLLEKLREDDLKDVREKCALHGFTTSDLRGALKWKGRPTVKKNAAAKPHSST